MPSNKKNISISEVLSFPNRIQNTLIFYYLFPVLLIFVILSSYFYISTKNSLDEELGKRLLTIAWISSTQVKAVQLASLQTTGIHGNTYKLIKNRFLDIAQKNEIDRIYLLDTQGHILLDSASDSNHNHAFERLSIHETEIGQTLQGTAVPSTLFKGNDGHFYKTAFSPIKDREDQVFAVVGVDGNARFFANLRKLEHRLIVSGAFFIFTILLISYILSRKIVTPIELLALAAKRIGDGQIEKEIKIYAKNEVGFLSYVMDEMRKKIVERDESLQIMLRGIAHEIRNPLGGIELFGVSCKRTSKMKKAKRQ
ncbi:MAG: HAMP domain-containing protein [Bdellovibrionota bacterium]